jgi:hypothetical protein
MPGMPNQTVCKQDTKLRDAHIFSAFISLILDTILYCTEASDYHFVSEDCIFCPPLQLVGCSLKLYCTPFRTEADLVDNTRTIRVYGR